MIWEEFRSQARQDLISCRTLYEKEHDYGNSAYLLQQGLEKFVKAYLFKFDLFIGQPYKLRHFPISKIWTLLRSNILKKIMSCNKESRDLFMQSSVLLDLIGTFFEKIDNPKDKRWKHAVWKYSLDLPLNTSETGIITSLKNDMEKEVIPLASNAYDLFSNGLKKILDGIGSDTQKKQGFENLVQKLTDMSTDELLNQKVSVQKDWNYVSEKTSKWFEKMQELITKIVYLADDKEKALQKDFTRILLLAWIFSLREELIQTFPHEELGRYPDSFDGKSSLKIYEENSLKLDALITRVSEGCDKIEIMLDL